MRIKLEELKNQIFIYESHFQTADNLDIYNNSKKKWELHGKLQDLKILRRQIELKSIKTTEAKKKLATAKQLDILGLLYGT